MRSGIFIVDILVNATGATIVLLFLFLARINPEPEPPVDVMPDVGLVWLDLDLPESSSILAELRVRDTDIVLYATSGSLTSTLPLKQSPDDAPDIGGASVRFPDKDTARFIIPCPPTETVLVLKLTFALLDLERSADTETVTATVDVLSRHKPDWVAQPAPILVEVGSDKSRSWLIDFEEETCDA